MLIGKIPTHHCFRILRVWHDWELLFHIHIHVRVICWFFYHFFLFTKVTKRSILETRFYVIYWILLMNTDGAGKDSHVKIYILKRSFKKKRWLEYPRKLDTRTRRYMTSPKAFNLFRGWMWKVKMLFLQIVVRTIPRQKI